jgi:crotonobetainyl-CoA:carnitine CoA-transferase CaiB-like acyl-CoA transferase
MLADLGARVIKVEALSSDPSRGMFHAFNGSNRGKYGLAMDIKAPQAAPIIAELVRSADVVTNNFRPGVSARLGLDGPSLHRERPEIVVLESPAYGSEGPKATKAGFDPIIQALTGHEHRGGGAGNAPLWNRGFMADFTGGQWGAIAMLAALLHRERTGAGATVTVALVNAGIFALSELIQRPDSTFVGAPPLDRDRTGFHPAEAMYQAADGWIALALRSDAAVAALARVLSLGTQLDAPLESWGEREARLIGTAVRGRTAANLLRELESAGVWCEECRRDGRREALQDPDLLGAGTICETVHRDVGRVRAVGPLVRFSRSRRGVVKAPPLIGQDTREVLGDLGLESAEIDKLLQDKVVA